MVYNGTSTSVPSFTPLPLLTSTLIIELKSFLSTSPILFNAEFVFAFELESLNKKGTEQVLTFFGSPEIQTMFYLYLLKKYKSKCFVRDEKRILGINIIYQN